MAGLLAYENRFTPLTSNRMISRMFNINSLIHICWDVLKVTYEIIFIIGDFPHTC
jgi:hypothetical protein